MGHQKLVCIDVDQTIFQEHVYKLLTKGLPPLKRAVPDRFAGIGVIKEQNDGSFDFHQKNAKNSVKVDQLGALTEDVFLNIIQNVRAWKNPLELSSAMMKALDNGHCIAMTSFTTYPEIIKTTLGYMFKHYLLQQNPNLLSAQEVEFKVAAYLKKILVLAGQGDKGKEEHIELAMQHFAIQDRADVMLVDDDEANAASFRTGAPLGINFVLVPKAKDADPNSYLPKMVQFTVKHQPNNSYLDMIYKWPQFLQFWSYKRSSELKEETKTPEECSPQTAEPSCKKQRVNE